MENSIIWTKVCMTNLKTPVQYKEISCCHGLGNMLRMIAMNSHMRLTGKIVLISTICWLLYLLLVGFCPKSAYCAQEGETAPIDTFSSAESIVVTANRVESPMENTPASVSIISQEYIQKGQRGIGLDEALAGLPGVLAQNRNNFAMDTRLSIRGFGTRSAFGVRGITILVDGIPETLADGQTAIDNIDLFSTERIEILRGPASALYGNSAGGVIQLFTEENRGKPFFSAIPLEMGSNGLKLSSLKSSGQAGKIIYTFSAFRFTLDGYRDYSRAEQNLFNGRLKVLVGKNISLAVHANYTDKPTARNPGALTLAQTLMNPRQAVTRNVQTHAAESAKQGKFGISLQGEWNRHSLSVCLFGIARSFDSNLPFAVIDLERRVAGSRFLYSHESLPLGTWNRFSIGVDIQRQQDDRTNHNNINGTQGTTLLLDQIESVSSYGIFLQNEMRFNNYFELSGAVRTDGIYFRADDRLYSDGDDSGKRNLTALSPQAGIIINPIGSPRFSLFGNIATSFESPTTTELVNRPDGEGGFNRELEPQRAVSYESGVRLKIADGLTFRGCGYVIHVSDELISFRVPDKPERAFYRNAGGTIHRGAETEISYIHPSGIMGRITATLTDVYYRNYATAEASFNGNKVPGIPQRMGAAEFGYLSKSGFFFRSGIFYTGKYFVDDGNTEANKSYRATNIRAGYEWKMGSYVIIPSLGIANLFDNRYNESIIVNGSGGSYYEPAPGRNAYAAVRLGYQF